MIKVSMILMYFVFCSKLYAQKNHANKHEVRKFFENCYIELDTNVKKQKRYAYNPTYNNNIFFRTNFVTVKENGTLPFVVENDNRRLIVKFDSLYFELANVDRVLAVKAFKAGDSIAITKSKMISVIVRKNGFQLSGRQIYNAICR